MEDTTLGVKLSIESLLDSIDLIVEELTDQKEDLLADIKDQQRPVSSWQKQKLAAYDREIESLNAAKPHLENARKAMWRIRG